MVTSIARQSIVIKCKLKESIMLGNYEFYYAAGLVSKLTGVEFDVELPPKQLYEAVKKTVTEYEPKNENEAYLVQLFMEFKPDETVDEQMKELFQWGLTEQRLWQE
ncbi:MAG: DUF3837 domain-containing protein [Roseburia sp.]|uniref:DUF3837 domain-containing protein n=1 Tax=Roseburia hominis TaxID=301301 RepID=UPI001F21BA3F|nr:DUF3837 domain-containing protein [Roseburia hominis]MDY4839648.1 DUF3837 domain-containing protein [Lachnospiraceae bacterium]